MRSEIKCNGCQSIDYKTCNPSAKTPFGRRWHIPSGWAVTVPSGWLCPKCK